MAAEPEQNAITELFEAVFEQDAMGMALRAVDPDNMRWLRVNQKFCDMLGYTREELLQLTAEEITLPEERPILIRHNKQILRGEFKNYTREKRYLRKDGSILWAKVWLQAVLDRGGHPTTFISMIHDITDQKKAETALMESEARFRAVFDHSPVCLNLKDVEGRYLFANKRYEEWWGFPAEEAIGKKASEFQADGFGIDAMTAAEQAVLDTGTAHESEISASRPHDDKVYDRLLIKFPVKSPDGSLLGIGTFAVDITERKRAEEELIRHRDHLQELVGRATDGLKSKAEELKTSLAKEKHLNELQRQFVSMASHEFRTPLAVIDSHAQRLKRCADDVTPTDAVKRADSIRAAVERMTHLMESTLAGARLQDGKIAVEMAPCDIGKLVRDVCARQQDIDQSHAIACEIAELPETIRADAGSLEQILNNLLSNAAKYSPKTRDIEILARTEGDHVVISVRDYGIGIGHEDLPRIGERFFRAQTSTGIAGTGIGLNLAKTLVEMHGGTFSVESFKGNGSTFTIRLPIAGPAQSEPANAKPSQVA